MASQLTEQQIDRYSRQLILPQVGGKGQERLLASSALIVGAGALGCPTAAYLAAAGVGRLGVADGDVVELSNLQRQILHRVEDIGAPKAASVRRYVAALNPDVSVEVHEGIVGPDNALEIMSRYDVAIDAADGFPTKYLLNDAAVLTGVPLVHGSILGFEGMVTTVVPGRGPCYRCLFPVPPPPDQAPTCQQAGVLGSVAGVVATLQANEALKLLLEIGEPLVGRLLLVDALDTSFRELCITPAADCRACGERADITDLSHFSADEFAGPQCRVQV